MRKLSVLLIFAITMAALLVIGSISIAVAVVVWQAVPFIEHDADVDGNISDDMANYEINGSEDFANRTYLVQVLDLTDNAPVSNATVDVFYISHNSIKSTSRCVKDSFFSTTQITTLHTNQTGHFIFVGDFVPNDNEYYSWRVTKENYFITLATGFENIETPPHTGKSFMYIDPKTNVTGIVIDSRSNARVLDATVAIVRDITVLPSDSTVEGYCSSTDGSFGFQGIHAGYVTIIASAPGYHTRVMFNVSLAKFTATNLKIILESGKEEVNVQGQLVLKGEQGIYWPHCLIIAQHINGTIASITVSNSTAGFSMDLGTGNYTFNSLMSEMSIPMDNKPCYICQYNRTVVIDVAYDSPHG